MRRSFTMFLSAAMAFSIMVSGALNIVASAGSVRAINNSISPASINTPEEREAAQQRLKDLQNELASLRTQIDTLGKNIKDGKNAATAAQQQKAALEREATLIEEQIVLKRQEIDFKDVEISTKISEISLKQTEFDTNEDLLVQRLIALYKTNNSSVLSTLLNMDDFSDFLVMSENLRRVSVNDTKLLERLTVERTNLEAAKAELETMMANLVTERQALDQLFADYQTNIAAQAAKASALMAQVAKDEADKIAAIKAVEEYQQEMEAVWASLGASSGEYIGGALLWPVPEYNGKEYISSSFGQRTLYGRPNFHTGMDVASGPKGGVYGKNIVAANAGTVVLVSTTNARTGYGYYVIIDHGGGIKTLYAHCDSISAQKGDAVSRGDVIATVGNTGNSTGPHLHFEIRVDNKAVDPFPYLNGSKSLG